ncbi:bifunctional phosphopantothenoylcysteine decarboxylase/phosphopantothenate--cysteine ligase CoaBC [Novispirillum itersonii]|uniref:bifunctional phosphopantothenoylcysteine decarboxylase/phosphopantothenate--cysteine ligase CoaBC n=1 Tax=Novispirillum itersonii TaxID=189 RepID=UPI0003753715|nr:bifunctional phosphopantothenoylcysteine decarboxylase/phosphopantothenate--cysteine ligase CoaBC [Novispirillum itersonii]
MSTPQRVLLIITGGIAAYKSLDLIRRLREQGLDVRCVLTEGATQFVTPLSVSALSENKVYQDLFSLTDEAEMGHIRLSREADLLVVAPCTANMMAKMAAGLADDLASTVLLATDKPVLIAPAMNLYMWANAATQANLATLQSRGITVVGPASGTLACGEVGAGRMSEIPDLVQAILRTLRPDARPLTGKTAVVTSGPTHEPIDPVRYIANRSSGKQGHAIAAALAALGADVTLISGPVTLPDPDGVRVVHVESARDMLAACQAALPTDGVLDVAVCAAAVADWGVDVAPQKLKKQEGAAPPAIALRPNPDILATLSAAGPQRPRLVVGFAAETESVIDHAIAKRARKGCDWICANDVSAATGTFGGNRNTVHLISADGVDSWPDLPKSDVATRLARRIADTLLPS